MNLNDLIKDGFYVSEVKDNRGNIADYSLLGALKSYFSTAEDLDWYLSRKDNNTLKDKEAKELLVGPYARDACNAITQFQHFFELFLKDILLEHSQLLVYDASQKPELLIKLIGNESISDSELENMHFIECSEAIVRIKALHNIGKLDPKYHFIANYFELFEKLNRLRNRIAHRGAFIVNPSALDEIFGKHIIPFVNQLKGVSGYIHVESWTFNLKQQNLNPFDAIAKEYQNAKVDENKIHLYKLIGSAAYKNRIDFYMNDIFGDYEKIQKKAEENANRLVEQFMSDVVECPVCGCKSFVYELDNYDDEDEFGNVTICETYVYRISCEQCGFHIEHWLLNKLRGFNIPIQDYSKW